MKKLKYSAMKVFHYPEKLASLPPETDDIGAPLHVRIKPTNACNQRCRYCSYLNEDMQIGRHMEKRDRIPWGKMKEVIDDCVAMGVKAVTLSGGGEPLFYSHITETLRRLSESPLSFAMLSNGSLLKGEPAELMARHATWLRISIDGWDNPSYSRYRGVKEGMFDTVMDSISKFKALGGKCSLGVSVIVDSDNVRYLYGTARRLKDSGADSLKVSPCFVSDDVLENQANAGAIMKKVKDQLARIATDLEDDSFEVYNHYHDLEDASCKTYQWCPLAQIQPVIGADMNIYACHYTAYNRDLGLMGTIRDKSFREFWLTDKRKFFKINPARDCKHFYCYDKLNKLITEYHYGLDEDHIPFV